ncbi:MAG: hypothetical protein ACREQ5_29550, partial [Candidatus Dormibacteria bacterium]
MHRRLMPACVFAVLALPVAGATSHVAAAPSGQVNTTCQFKHQDVLSPGLSTSPSSGTWTTGGETGTITCKGPINGHQPAGAGSWGGHGRYGTSRGVTCTSGGDGDGVLSLTVPTSKGSEHIDDAVTFTFGPMRSGGLFSGVFQG